MNSWRDVCQAQQEIKYDTERLLKKMQRQVSQMILIFE
jgi:hypothetical protein